MDPRMWCAKLTSGDNTFALHGPYPSRDTAIESAQAFAKEHRLLATTVTVGLVRHCDPAVDGIDFEEILDLANENAEDNDWGWVDDLVIKLRPGVTMSYAKDSFSAFMREMTTSEYWTMAKDGRVVVDLVTGLEPNP